MKVSNEILAVILGALFGAVGYMVVLVTKMDNRLVRLETKFEDLPFNQPNQPRNIMKKTMSCLVLIGLIAAFAAVLFFGSGCVTSNPNRQPTINADGSTNFPPAFVADSGAVSNALWKVVALIDASAPVNPYAAPIKAALPIAGLIAMGISAVFGKLKSSQAAKATATTQTMAAGVVAANAQQKVLDVASSTPQFAAVANHLNEAKP